MDMTTKNNLEQKIEFLGAKLLDYFHLIGLFILAITVLWTAILYLIKLVTISSPTLKDILMLFIYLEIGAMIGVYFKTHKLPVQFLIYIAITALTRVLTIDIKTMGNMSILTISCSILIMSISVIILQYRHIAKDCESCIFSKEKLGIITKK
jgi:phosphate starvation-inducible membrane PsiE